MYAEWASLQNEIQCDKANQSVLHKFPAVVGREVACSVVRHITQNLSIAASNSEPSNLNTDKEVKWTMEVGYKHKTTHLFWYSYSMTDCICSVRQKME